MPLGQSAGVTVADGVGIGLENVGLEDGRLGNGRLEDGRLVGQRHLLRKSFEMVTRCVSEGSAQLSPSLTLRVPLFAKVALSN